MTQPIKISQILVYYDDPQVFVATNLVGQRYIGLLVDEDEKQELIYICVPVSRQRFEDYYFGRIDLRTVFTYPEISIWLIAKGIENEWMETTEFEGNDLPEDYLPERGFYHKLAYNDRNQSVIRDSLEFNNVALHLRLSNGNGGIEMGTLAEFSKSFQNLVRNVAKNVLMEESQEFKHQYQREENYNLYAHSGGHGSFVLHLHSRSEGDFPGNVLMERILAIIDTLIVKDLEKEKVIEALRTVKGHALNSYKKILEDISSSGITFEYEWHAPLKTKPSKRVISTAYAKQVNDFLSEVEELIYVEVSFEGTITKIDLSKGAWSILNEEDEIEYQGSANPEHLAGIVSGTQRYRLVCQESIESVEISGRETKSYALMTISPV